jgi:hypothetical protein
VKQLDSLLCAVRKETLTKTRLPAVINEIRGLDSYTKLCLLARNSVNARKQMCDAIKIWIKTSYDLYLSSEDEAYLDSAIAIIFVVITDSTDRPDYKLLSSDLANQPSLHWAKLIAQSYMMKEAAHG